MDSNKAIVAFGCSAAYGQQFAFTQSKNMLRQQRILRRSWQCDCPSLAELARLVN
jgi:hypothetical protein